MPGYPGSKTGKRLIRLAQGSIYFVFRLVPVLAKFPRNLFSATKTETKLDQLCHKPLSFFLYSLARSILCDHWYPLFQTWDDSAHGFLSQGGLIITCTFWLIWYSTKRAYVIMICPSCIVVIRRRCRHLCTALLATGFRIETSYLV